MFRKVLFLAAVLFMALSLSAWAEEPDYGNDCNSAEPIEPNGTVVEGVLSDTTDEDWFSFTAVADGLYEMTFLSQSGRKDLNVYGPDGCPDALQQIALLQANTGSVTREVFIESAGTYYIQVYGNVSGLYRVSVNLLSEHPTDTYPDTCVNPATLVVDDPCGPVYDGITDYGMEEDWFTFATSVLHKYQVSLYRAVNTDVVYDLYRTSCGDLLSGSLASSITFVSWDGANYDLRVKSSSFNKEGYYEIWVDDLGEVPDDYGNSCDVATTIATNGDPCQGFLEYSADLFSDEDWFSFTASADGLYEIAFLSQSGAKYLDLCGPDGCPDQLQLITSIDNYGGGWVVNEVFVEMAGTYYVKVSDGSGLYRVGVNEVYVCGRDIHPDTCDDPCELVVDAPAILACITDYGMDEDWFTFAASTLHKYQITLTQAVNTDVKFGLHESDCGDQLYSTDASMTVIPCSDSNYDLRVHSSSFAKDGYYKILVEDLGEPPDDHGHTYDTATPIPTTGVEVTGHTGQYSATIGCSDDEDWFSFTAAPGLYEIALYAESCGGIYTTSPPTYLYLYALDEAHELHQITYFSANGSTVTQSVSIDTAGTYYIRVYDGCGYYWVSVLAAEPQCGDPNHPYPSGDMNHDCVVNFVDFAMIANNWLADTRP